MIFLIVRINMDPGLYWLPSYFEFFKQLVPNLHLILNSLSKISDIVVYIVYNGEVKIRVPCSNELH